MRTKPLSPEYDDPDYVEDVARTLEEDLADAEDMRTTPKMEFTKMKHADYIAYLRERAARLRHEAEGAGG
jgi:hypothetical protein